MRAIAYRFMAMRCYCRGAWMEASFRDDPSVTALLPKSLSLLRSDRQLFHASNMDSDSEPPDSEPGIQSKTSARSSLKTSDSHYRISP
jgi:hypothetical protein